MPTIRIRKSWMIGWNSHARRLTGSALSVAGETIRGVGAGVGEAATVGAGVAGAPGVSPGASDAAGAAEDPGAGDWAIGSQAPTARATRSRTPARGTSRSERRRSITEPGRSRPDARDGSARCAWRP